MAAVSTSRYDVSKATARIFDMNRAPAEGWLDPAVEHTATRGYTGRELSRIARQIRDHRAALIRRWDEACEGKST